MDFLLWPFLIFLIILLLSGIKIIDQYERGVILTLGTFSGILTPGLRIVIPIIQRLIKVDMRITTLDIPKQEVITKDNVPVGINAVVYFQVEKPDAAVLKIQNYEYAVSQYAQTALRDVIGGVELDSLLTEREQIAEQIYKEDWKKRLARSAGKSVEDLLSAAGWLVGQYIKYKLENPEPKK